MFAIELLKNKRKKCKTKKRNKVDIYHYGFRHFILFVDKQSVAIFQQKNEVTCKSILKVNRKPEGF